MANEFRIKHGLIVTGSSYFSESMFAPNLPEETNPSYYITWRDTDGRFEVSTITPGSQANTVACWDYASGDPSTGEWGVTGDIGNTTTYLYINNVDNNSNNQYSLLNGIGIGSVITLYIGPYKTSFQVTGVIKPTSTGGGGTGTWSFQVSYLSGDEYSITSTPEMCLGVAAASVGTSAAYCIDYTMASSFTAAAFNDGEGGFDRYVGGFHYTPPFGTVDTNIIAIFLNNDAMNNTNGITFFNGFVLGDFLSISWNNKVTHFKVTNLGGMSTATPNMLINVTFNGGDTGYTIPTGEVFTICKSPGL
jgi:hypothetical protein